MENFEEFIKNRGRETADLVLNFCQKEAHTIVSISDKIIHSLKNGGKVLLAGNGGSAADAQHFAAELVNRFLVDRRPLPAIALTTDSSVLTSIANDYSFEQVFSRQVQALAKEGDVFLGISTSGASPNILAAMEKANAHSLVTVGVTGKNSSHMAPLCDVCLSVPDTRTPLIQEAHAFAFHVICEIVEKRLFSNEK